MSVLEKASLVLIPSGYKEDVLYSQVPNTSAGDFTFTRASTGTRVNSDGYIEEVPWNLINYSEDFSQSSWSKVGTTVIGGFPSPNGPTNAYKLVEDTSSGAHYLAFVNISAKSGSYYTSSAFFKKGESNFIQLLFSSSSHAGGNHANFDLQNGVVGNVSDGVAEIESIGEYYRCSYTSQATASTTTNVFFWKVQSATSSRAESYSGDGTSGVYVWGAQAVKGNAPKPYIKTTDRLDIPRLDYSGGATCPTLLLEPQRTNKSNNSEDFTVTGYVKNNVTVTANQITSPDNTQTADQLDFGSGSGFFYENVTTITAASTYSVFVKYIDYQYIQIIGTGDVNHYANFDIENGIVGNTGSASTASIEDYGNGWYRCIINYNSGTFAGGAILYKVASLTAGWASGGGDAGSFYFWGNQMELGTFHTSYIPSTSGTSTTRTLESGIVTSATSLIGQTEGTLYSEFDLTEDNNFTFVEINLGNSTSNRILAYRNGSYIQFIVQSGGVVEINNPTLVTFLDINKIAVTYQTDDFKIYLNGSLVKTYTSGNIPSGFDTIDLQDNNLQGRKQGIKSLAIFKEILTDDELVVLTGGTVVDTYNWIDSDLNEIITSDGDNLIFT